MESPVLQLQDVQVHFPVESGFLVHRRTGTVRAVDGVSLTLARGEVLGLVGESGCGKSTLARAIMRLLPVSGGEILFEGRPLARADAAALRVARRGMQMIFQDPFASLNPRLSVHAALEEPLHVHGICPPEDIPARIARLLDLVGLSRSQQHKYPHEFSGGQRQRIAIARALAVEPRLLIADEPVSALDVSIQAQILNLLSDLVREMNLSLLFIAHDLSVVRHVSDRVAVMYLGRIVELGRAAEVIGRPQHPYTRALISAIPTLAADGDRPRIVLPGEPPSPISPPSGCAFHPRCAHAQTRCAAAVPALRSTQSGHQTACVRVGEI